jgi:hypothetical protein
MCYYLYLGSNSTLPLIEWQEADPAFNVAELQDYDSGVVKQFSKSSIVFLGSHTGCSCGFLYDGEPFEDENEKIEDADARESVRKLVEYLTVQSANDSLELFVCWNGDQGDEPVKVLAIEPGFFIGDEFPLGDHPTFLTIEQL